MIVVFCQSPFNFTTAGKMIAEGETIEVGSGRGACAGMTIAGNL